LGLIDFLINERIFEKVKVNGDERERKYCGIERKDNER
jgi:hypothetical protein